MLTILELTLILLIAAVVIVVVFRAFGFPPLVAYLTVGVLLGPNVADLAANHDAVHDLGEIGVVFLMFSLGLEFNLDKLQSIRRHVFGLGGAQVLSTIALVLVALLAMPLSWQISLIGAQVDWRIALVIGGATAMSSTAMVSKLLTEGRELETDHGQRAFGVLLFQDLAVIPLLVVIPALRGDGLDLALGLVLAIGKAIVLLVGLLRFGPHWMRRWFNLVARQRSHELFTLNVLLATLLFAWITSRVGLSMELGAFVAGMLIAETEFRYQVEEDIKPFRDVLLGLFFIGIGMQLNLSVLVEAWPRVLLLLTVPLLVKFAIVGGLVVVLGGAPGTAIRTGIWLAQAGEFGFVLLTLASSIELIPDAISQPAMAAMLLSLLVSPILISKAGAIALRLSGQEWLQRSLQLQRIATAGLDRTDHVILCGFGRCGQAIGHVLESEQVKYLALDLDPDRVRDASQSGEPVVYGDSSRRESLLAAGIHRARAVVITFDDTADALKVLNQVRELAPGLPVLVRASHDADFDRLRAAGATEVVSEIAEGSLMLASHVMALAGVPLTQVQRRMAEVRAGRYALLRGFFRGADDRGDAHYEIAQQHLRAVRIDAGSGGVGRPIGDLDLNPARIVTLVRQSSRIIDPPPDTVLQAGDALVLAGTLEQVSAAADRIAASKN